MEKKTKNMLIEWLKVPIVINSVHWGPEDIYGTQIGSFAHMLDRFLDSQKNNFSILSRAFLENPLFVHFSA